MDLPELERAKKLEQAAAAEEHRWKVWFAANYEEAIIVACLAASVGLIVGAVFGYVVA